MPGQTKSARKVKCYCGSLRQVTRVITQLYDRYLKPAGMITAQFSLLRFVVANRGARTSDLAKALLIDTSTLTRTLANLESIGWIAREISEDRRERRWVITREGGKRLDRAIPLWEQAQAELDEKIGSADMRRLARTVSEISAKLAA